MPRRSTIDRIVARTGCSRDWLVHGRGEPSILFPHPTRSAPGYTEERVERALNEAAAAAAASSSIEHVVLAIELALGPTPTLPPRQKARLIAVAAKVYTAMTPEDRHNKFGALVLEIINLLLEQKGEQGR